MSNEKSQSEWNEPVGSDRPLDAILLATLADSLEPVQFAPERQAALRQRILQRVADAKEDTAAPIEQPGLVTIRSYQEGWTQALPGVHIKLLNAEGGAESYLVRLEAGAKAPAHGHPAIEECIVLEGSVKYIGGATLRAGDYQLAKQGAQHSELISDSGALVFLRYAQPLSKYIPL